MVNGLKQDLRYAGRALRHRPTLSFLAVASLAIGIAAVASTLALIDALDIRQLPYRAANQLVAIHTIQPGSACPTCLQPYTLTDFVQLRERSQSFDGLAAYRGQRVTQVTDGVTNRIWIAAASSNLASMLGVSPSTGRFFGGAEEAPGEDHVIVLSHEYRRTHFADGAPVLGRVISLGEGTAANPVERYTIIGVMPNDFAIPPGMDGWIPLNTHPGFDATAHVDVVGRLSPGVTLSSAEAELAAMPLAVNDSASRGTQGVILSIRRSLIQYDGQLGSGRFALLAIAISLLVLTLVNLTSLLSAQNAARETEFAIRAALGASSIRLVTQPILEAAIVTAIGGIVAGVITNAILPFLAMQLGATATGVRLAFDGRVAVICGAVTLVCVIAFGGALWRQARRLQIRMALTSMTATPRPRQVRKQATILALEIAGAFFVVSAATLLASEFNWIRNHAPGYDAAGLEYLPLAGLSPAISGEQLVSSAQLGVGRGVAAVQGQDAYDAEYQLPGSDKPIVRADVPFRTVVSASYFSALGIPLVHGRPFVASDRAGSADVAIVNRAAAARLWPDQDAIGKVLTMTRPGENRRRVVVVGEVDNSKVFTVLGGPSQPAIYRPIDQVGARPYALFVRADGRAVDVAGAVQAAVSGMFAQPIQASDIKSMSAYLDRETRVSRINARLLEGASAIVMILAMLGIYGLATYTILARSREIAMRMVLGANRVDVAIMVLKQTALVLVIGLIAGGVAFVASRKIVSSMFALNVTVDYSTLLIASALLGATALLATLVPLRRALSISPVEVLRG